MNSDSKFAHQPRRAANWFRNIIAFFFFTAASPWRQLLLLISCCAAPSCFGGAGVPDYSFNTGAGPNSDGAFFVVRELQDGRLACGGLLSNEDGTPRNGIMLLNPDGSLDTTFNPGAGANGVIVTIAQQPDGKLLLGGSFGGFAGAAVTNIVRLNLDGSVDEDFNTAGINGFDIAKIVVDAQNRILIAGQHLSLNGEAISSVIRLTPSGTLDASFHCKVDLAPVSAMDLGPNRSIWIGGNFANVNGLAVNRVALLTESGDLDSSFVLNSGPAGSVAALYAYPDGKCLVQGSFTNFDGIARTNLARLLPDGNLDASFVPPPSSPQGTVNSIAVQADGKIIVGGKTNLIRLMASGDKDPHLARRLSRTCPGRFPACSRTAGSWLAASSTVWVYGRTSCGCTATRPRATRSARSAGPLARLTFQLTRRS